MIQKKTVALLKSHIIQKKIAQKNVIATMRKNDLCKLVWDFYHKDTDNTDDTHITKKLKVSLKISKDKKNKKNSVANKDTIDKIKTKNTPDQPAKTYPIGTVIKSNNSDFYYMVSQRKDSVYFWKKVSPPVLTVV